MASLRELARELPEAVLEGDDAIAVAAVSYDSRSVEAGHLFVAIPGFRQDGHDYIQQAIAAGAAALVVQSDRAAQVAALGSSFTGPVLALPDTRSALSKLAAAYYGYPARRLRTIGVTGTDGKTSLAHLLGHLLRSAGLKAGLSSTIRSEIDGRAIGSEDKRHTSPEAPHIQRLLSEMLAGGCAYAILECTSHGLALHRLDDCEFDIGVVTNVGSDHLDFHSSYEDYLRSKAILLELAARSVHKGLPKTAVLNADDPSFEYLAACAPLSVVAYGIDQEADVRASDVELASWKTSFQLRSSQGVGAVATSQPGRPSVYNSLAAAAVGSVLALEPKAVREALESWPGVRGRMELVNAGQPFRVVVDFAHAPASLRRVLEFLRPLTPGRIIAVFGCIGERDKERRFPMGEASAELADYTILTDDNPYTENRQAVIDDIARGALAAGKEEGKHFRRTPNRREAIAYALEMAAEGDTVLLAGKGHERTVHLIDGSYECDDREVAKEALQQLYPS